MKRVYDEGQCGRKESIREAAPVLEKYGINYVNIQASILTDRETFLEADRVIKAHGLHWGMLPTPMDAYDEKLSDGEFDAALETLKKWADFTAGSGELKAYNHIWNGSNLREYEAEREWVIKRAERIAEILEDAGISYGFEFLGPVPLKESFRYPFFSTLPGVLSIADEIGKNVGFVFDTYHWYTGADMDMGVLYYAAAHPERIINFHVEDGIAGRTRTEQEDLVRAMPMTTGVIDSQLACRVLKQGGYDGLIMCEALNPWRIEAAKRPFEEVIRELRDAYRRVEGE